jgi:hypothetical protein
MVLKKEKIKRRGFKKGKIKRYGFKKGKRGN